MRQNPTPISKACLSNTNHRWLHQLIEKDFEDVMDLILRKQEMSEWVETMLETHYTCTLYEVRSTKYTGKLKKWKSQYIEI